MNSAKQISDNAIWAYVKESIQLLKDGRRIEPQRNKPVKLTGELETALQKSAKARKAFAELHPGLKREYADYIASAKRVDTKQRRIDKIMPMIVAGEGLNDKYR